MKKFLVLLTLLSTVGLHAQKLQIKVSYEPEFLKTAFKEFLPTSPTNLPFTPRQALAAMPSLETRRTWSGLTLIFTLDDGTEVKYSLSADDVDRRDFLLLYGLAEDAPYGDENESVDLPDPVFDGLSAESFDIVMRLWTYTHNPAFNNAINDEGTIEFIRKELKDKKNVLGHSTLFGVAHQLIRVLATLQSNRLGYSVACALLSHEFLATASNADIDFPFNTRNADYFKKTMIPHAYTNTILTTHKLTGHNRLINSAQFSLDGTYVVTASADNTARVWDLRKQPGQDGFCRTLEGHRGWINSAQFSPDGNYVVTASADHTARVWDLHKELGQDGFCLTLEGHSDWVNSAQFSPDGNYVVTASADRTARIWDLRKQPGQDGFCRILIGHRNWIYSAQFSPDGNYVVTASADRTARIWDLRKQPDQEGFCRTLEGHRGWIHSAQFSPDGNYVVTASHDHTARVWDLRKQPDQEGFCRTLEGHSDWVYSAQFSPDGNYVVTASADHTARVWDLHKELGQDGFCLTLEGHSGRIYSAQFSPDGNYVVTGSDDCTARVWNLRKQPGQDGFCHTLTGHSIAIRSVQFSPDGNYVSTASYDSIARIWSLNKELTSLTSNQMLLMLIRHAQKPFTTEAERIEYAKYVKERTPKNTAVKFEELLDAGQFREAIMFFKQYMQTDPASNKKYAAFVAFLQRKIDQSVDKK